MVGVAFCFGASSATAVPADWFGYPTDIPGSAGTIVTTTPAAATSGSASLDLLVTADAATGGVVTSPTGATITQGYWAIPSTQTTPSWVRAEFVCPTGLATDNSPYALITDLSNYILGGSEFTSNLSYGLQNGTSTPTGNLPATAIAGTSRGVPGTPIRVGLVLSGSSDLPPNPQMLYNVGPIASATAWSSEDISGSSIVNPATVILLGNYALATASGSDLDTQFQNVFIPLSTTGYVYQYDSGNPAPTTTTTFGAIFDEPWVIFGADVVLDDFEFYDVASGLPNGVFEFLGDVTVPANSTIINATVGPPTVYNTTFVLGPSNTFTGPGFMDLGQIMAQSANWRLVNATVRASLGGPTNAGTGSPIASLIFFPGSSTTIGANSQLISSDNMELWQDATLRGLGTLSAGTGLTTAGTIIPGDGATLGTLTFSGTDLVCDPTSLIITRVRPGENSRLTVDGTVTRDGTLRIIAEPGGVPTIYGQANCCDYQTFINPDFAGFYLEGDRYVVLSGDSFLQPDFNLELIGFGPTTAFLQLNLEEEPTPETVTEYVVTVSRYRDYLATACLPNDRKVAAALDLARTSGCQSLDLATGLAVAIDPLPDSAFACPCVWDQISGQEILGVLQSAVQTSDQLSRAMQWQIWRAQDPVLLSSGSQAARVWGDASYRTSSWTSGIESLHVDSQGGFGLVGLDAFTEDSFLLGISGHYSHAQQSWASYNTKSSFWLAGAGVYAGLSSPLDWWLDGGSLYATLTTQVDLLQGKMDRTALLNGPLFDGNCARCITSNPEGITCSGRAEVGYRWNAPLLWQPYVAMQGSWVRLQSFCETAFPVQLPLRTLDNTAHELYVCPGVRVSGVLESPSQVITIPELVLEVNQRIGGNLNHAWVGFQGSPYFVDLEGAPLPRTAIFVSGGLQLLWNRHVSAQIRANLQRAEHFSSSGVDAQISLTF